MGGAETSPASEKLGGVGPTDCLFSRPLDLARGLVANNQSPGRAGANTNTRTNPLVIGPVLSNSRVARRTSRRDRFETSQGGRRYYEQAPGVCASPCRGELRHDNHHGRHFWDGAKIHEGERAAKHRLGHESPHVGGNATAADATARPDVDSNSISDAQCHW